MLVELRVTLHGRFVPIGPRRPDVFIEIQHAARLQRAQDFAKQALQLRDVMKRLVNEDRVVEVRRKRRAIEIGREVADLAIAFSARDRQ